MGIYVGNEYRDNISSADFGGNKLLGVKSLTNYINYGNSSWDYNPRSDCFVSGKNAKKKHKKTDILDILGKVMTAGIVLACIVKTGIPSKTSDKSTSWFKKLKLKK